jgi:hypothetical protein
MDANRLMQPPESFDAVWGIGCSEHLAEKRRFLAACAHLPRPGGVLALCAWLVPEDLRSTARARLIAEVARGMLCPSLSSGRDYVSWMRASGFDHIKAEDLRRRVEPTTLHHFRVGDTMVTLRVYRKESGASDYEVLNKRGRLHVIRRPSPWSLTASSAERLKDALTSLLPGPSAQGETQDREEEPMGKDTAQANIASRQPSRRATRRDMLIAGGTTLFGMAFAGAASGQTAQPAAPMALDQAAVERLIAGWKQKPQEVARQMLAKYGVPHEATAVRLIWHNTGPWKRTELVNEEIPHNFPKPHPDMLLQAIDYHVPPQKYDALAEYDGSVSAERTKGELAARCDMEEANFLALNLAHEVVTGVQSVAEARQFYAEAMRDKQHLEYLQGFRFQVPRAPQGDPDQEVLGQR